MKANRNRRGATQPDEKTRERSAEERKIVTPTPRNVRAKAEGDEGKNDEKSDPPATDTRSL
ncbi:hypothetical protein BIV23_08565 [Streptomyces monashensis]|uniref:Uncharacterized protein n=1 Tax=Streptomyces monashensis TaxID=1678012 RepID=A0A1S2QJS0_9ACTN|nr:hypothetical protein BIV23_08565 [Streptomyces monashensis]